jgi:hypothetical protein
MSGAYHVVCHDCPFEGLYESSASALEEIERHTSEYDHRMSDLEISRSRQTA